MILKKALGREREQANVKYMGHGRADVNKSRRIMAQSVEDVRHAKDRFPRKFSAILTSPRLL